MKKISELKKEWFLNQIDILKKKGVTKADISRDMGVLPQYLNSITNGNRGITDQFLDKFIEMFKVNQIDLFEEETYSCSLCIEKDKYIEIQRKLIERLERDNEKLESELRRPNIDIKKILQGD